MVISASQRSRPLEIIQRITSWPIWILFSHFSWSFSTLHVDMTYLQSSRSSHCMSRHTFYSSPWLHLLAAVPLAVCPFLHTGLCFSLLSPKYISPNIPFLFQKLIVSGAVYQPTTGTIESWGCLYAAITSQSRIYNTLGGSQGWVISRSFLFFLFAHISLWFSIF